MRHSTALILVLGSLLTTIVSAGDGRLRPRARALRPGLAESRREMRTAHNVLVLVADDLGVDMLSAYGEGSDLPQTPFLSALADDGILFRNAWSQPVCSPTRAGIMTGTHGFRNGIGWVMSSTGAGMNPSLVTLPHVLDAGGSGYVMGAFGKWHLGNAGSGGSLAPNLVGFDHFSGTLSSLFPPSEDYSHWTHVIDGSSSFETTYEPEKITGEAIAWMNAQTQPFFCYLAFNLPHEPYHRPPDYLHHTNFAGVNPNPAVQPRPYYKAMVEAMDTLVGRVLAQVDPQVLDDTLVVFLGDNGTPAGVVVPPFIPSHGKTTTYEGGVNVPLIISGPIVTMPGAECAGLVQTLDLYATIAETAGVDHEAYAPGVHFDTVSLVPYLLNPLRPSIRSTVYADLFYPNGEPPQVSDYSCPTVPPMRSSAFVHLTPTQQVVCQTDMGFGGPGDLRLRICGPGLSFEANSLLTIDNGPPGGTGVLLEGNGIQAMPFGLGTLLPAPALYFQSTVFTLDPTGTYRRSISQQGGTELIYYQAVVADSMVPSGFAISNVVRARFFTHSSAIRNTRYKLMLDAYTCEEAFFDLSVDPFELTNLLGQGLDASEKTNYDALKAALFALVFS